MASIKAPIGKYDPNYNMEHPKRGQAVIFNHLKFESRLNLTERNGTETDCSNLSKTLLAMGFTVSIHDDLSRDEISAKLGEVAAQDHSKEDCLLVAVMTHGMDGGVVFAKDKQYRVDELWGNFTVKKSPTLAAKPKIFLIQACRGGNTNNEAMNMSPAQKDGSSKQSMMFKMPNNSDTVIMFSTIDHFASWRHPKDGSWLIQSFCSVMDADKYSDDFLSLLTQTSHKIVTDFDQMDVMQSSCVQSWLTRKIFFKSK